MKITNMEQLKEKAFGFKYGLEVHYPQWGKDEWIYPLNSQSTEKFVFAHNNGIYAFVDGNGNEYIIPYFDGISDILRKSGYKETSFHVPFSNWDKPKDFYSAQKWAEVKRFFV